MTGIREHHPADPELSIVVVSWNTKALLADCLASLARDPRSAAWEVLVVDNASADGSADMVAADFPWAQLIRSERNLGFAGGNNLALRRARGRHLLLLNSDTRVPAGALGPLVDALDAEADVGAVGPRLVDAAGRLEMSCGRAPSLGGEIVHKLLLHRLFPFFRFGRWDHRSRRDVGWVTGACLMVRGDAARAEGYLDEGIFMCYEDLEWCLRLRAAGWRILYLPDHEVVHLEGQSIRQRMGEMLVVSQQSLYYLFQKHFGRCRLQALRGLTLVEMVLRTALWSTVWLLRPNRRAEAADRLGAYRRIARRTLMDRSYWAPFDGRTDRGPAPD